MATRMTRPETVSSTGPRQRIGPVIRELRQQQHLSLSDLAAQTGISVSYLSRLEKGRSVPSFTLLSDISEKLGVDIGFFVQTEHDAQAIDRQLAAALGQTPLSDAVVRELLGLSLDARKELLAFVGGQGTAAVGETSQPQTRGGRKPASAARSE